MHRQSWLRSMIVFLAAISVQIEVHAGQRVCEAETITRYVYQNRRRTNKTLGLTAGG